MFVDIIKAAVSIDTSVAYHAHRSSTKLCPIQYPVQGLGYGPNLPI